MSESPIKKMSQQFEVKLDAFTAVREDSQLFEPGRPDQIEGYLKQVLQSD